MWKFVDFCRFFSVLLSERAWKCAFSIVKERSFEGWEKNCAVWSKSQMAICAAVFATWFIILPESFAPLWVRSVEIDFHMWVQKEFWENLSYLLLKWFERVMAWMYNKGCSGWRLRLLRSVLGSTSLSSSLAIPFLLSCFSLFPPFQRQQKGRRKREAWRKKERKLERWSPLGASFRLSFWAF